MTKSLSSRNKRDKRKREYKRRQEPLELNTGMVKILFVILGLLGLPIGVALTLGLTPYFILNVIIFIVVYPGFFYGLYRLTMKGQKR